MKKKNPITDHAQIEGGQKLKDLKIDIYRQQQRIKTNKNQQKRKVESRKKKNKPT